MKLVDWIDITNINLLNLSLNPNAIYYLKNNYDKIDWDYLSSNENAIELLKEKPDKINWKYLSLNINAIELLKENQDKIKWEFISFNTAIFTYDYEKIKKNKKELNEELVIKALHPKRMLKLMEIYGEEEIYKNYFDDD